MKVETRKREEGKEGKKRETTDPKLTIFSQRQLPLMVIVVVIVVGVVVVLLLLFLL